MARPIEGRPICFQTMHNDAAANPDHGGRADGAEKCQEDRHAENEGASERPAQTANGRSVVSFFARATPTSSAFTIRATTP